MNIPCQDRHEDVVVDVVKAALDVTFDKPCRARELPFDIFQCGMETTT